MPLPEITNVVAVDDAVFGEGCGTAAGAGLADEVGGGCTLGETTAPEFNDFRPRVLCEWK